jgi:hypothetical protein
MPLLTELKYMAAGSIKEGLIAKLQGQKITTEDLMKDLYDEKSPKEQNDALKVIEDFDEDKHDIFAIDTEMERIEAAFVQFDKRLLDDDLFNYAEYEERYDHHIAMAQKHILSKIFDNNKLEKIPLPKPLQAESSKLSSATNPGIVGHALPRHNEPLLYPAIEPLQPEKNILDRLINKITQLITKIIGTLRTMGMNDKAEELAKFEKEKVVEIAHQVEKELANAQQISEAEHKLLEGLLRKNLRTANLDIAADVMDNIDSKQEEMSPKRTNISPNIQARPFSNLTNIAPQSPTAKIQARDRAKMLREVVKFNPQGASKPIDEWKQSDFQFSTGSDSEISNFINKVNNAITNYIEEPDKTDVMMHICNAVDKEVMQSEVNSKNFLGAAALYSLRGHIQGELKKGRIPSDTKELMQDQLHYLDTHLEESYKKNYDLLKEAEAQTTKGGTPSR